MRELYRLVLVDTPLGKYFSENVSSDDLDEMNVEIMRNTLYKVRKYSSHALALIQLEKPFFETVSSIKLWKLDRLIQPGVHGRLCQVLQKHWRGNRFSNE